MVYGFSVLCCVKVIFNEVVKLVVEVCVIEQVWVGEVVFGIMLNYVIYFVLQLLVEFYCDWFGLCVIVIIDGFFELIDWVKIELIDFGFGLIGQVYCSDGIVIEVICLYCVCVFVGVLYLLV